MSNASALLRKSLEIAESEEFERFKLNAADFLSARDGGESVETRLAQMTASLEGVAELVNRSLPPSATKDRSAGSNVNLISPVVVPTSRRFLWLLPVVLGAVVGLVGLGLTSLVDNAFGLTNVALTFFGPHFWLLLLAYAGYRTWRESYVMVPDGCQALITRFGKLETVAEAGRVQLLNRHQRSDAGADLRAEGGGDLRPGGRKHPEPARQPQPPIFARRALCERQYHPRRAVQPGISHGFGGLGNGAGG